MRSVELQQVRNEIKSMTSPSTPFIFFFFCKLKIDEISFIVSQSQFSLNWLLTFFIPPFFSHFYIFFISSRNYISREKMGKEKRSMTDSLFIFYFSFTGGGVSYLCPSLNRKKERKVFQSKNLSIRHHSLIYNLKW